MSKTTSVFNSLRLAFLPKPLINPACIARLIKAFFLFDETYRLFVTEFHSCYSAIL